VLIHSIRQIIKQIVDATRAGPKNKRIPKETVNGPKREQKAAQKILFYSMVHK
jgi:hypothetical protein